MAETTIDGDETESNEGGDAAASTAESRDGPTVVKAPVEAAEPLRRAIDREDCRVLSARTVERIEGMSEALARAENRARQIVERARREAEEIRREAREQGRREGYEELLDEIGAVRERYRQIQDEAEEDTLELAFRVAKRLVGREIDQDPGVVRDIVEQALERVRGKRHVVVRVHPEDASVLESHRDALSDGIDGASVYIEPDDGVQRGGCLLETETNRVDARLDVQLDRLREVLTDSE